MLSAIALRRFASRLREDRSGLAYMEFAMAAPILLTLGLGGLEVAHFALAVEEVSQIAMTTADNAGRVRISIDEADVNDVMTGAKLVGSNIDFGNHGRIILSSLEPNGLTGTKAGQYVHWQRCSGAKAATSSYGVQGAGQTNGSLQAMGPTGNQIAAASGTAVMFVEVSYDYQPLVGNFWLGGAHTINYTSAFNVRQRTDQNLYNADNLATAQTSACSVYSA